MDWQRIIKRALKAGRFTRTARGLANKWTSCAVGEAHTNNSRIVKVFGAREVFAPRDRSLDVLGMNFSRDVANDDPKAAARTYAEIQARVTELALGLE